MSSFIQLISLVSSFVFGCFLFYLYKFNLRIINRTNILFKIVISCLFVFNLSLGYVCFLYWLNRGILHIYNLIFILIGYYLVNVKQRKL